MKKIAFILTLLPFSAMAATDAEIELTGAFNKVRMQCRNISAELEPLKKMAGIGTAVNAVGTLAGAGGVASGIAKYEKDKNVATSMGEKYSIEVIKEKLKDKELSPENQAALKRFQDYDTNVNWTEIEAGLNKLSEEFDKQDSQSKDNVLKELDAKEAAAQARIDENQKQSDMYGNIRTGLFATNTATSIAGAIVSSKTGMSGDLKNKIQACVDSLTALEKARTRVRVEDGENANATLMSQAQNILDKCNKYNNVDTSAFNKLAKGATITGALGGVTGAAATATSIAGTTNKLSDIDLKSENAAKEMNKQEGVNVASNILGGVTAVTSLTGTVLNATQIKKIKDVVTIAEECEEALK